MKILSVTLLVALLGFSAVGQAHTGIKSTSPQNDAVLTSAPETLGLEFKGNVRLFKVTLSDADKQEIDIGFNPTTKAAKSFSVALPPLAASRYTVDWVSMSKDGHKVTGDFSFEVAQAKAESPMALLTVYKTPTCGCCSAWIEHMKDNGFTVEAHDKDDLQPYKAQAKLGAGLQSCHTAFIGGYAIEGHVPADDVKRLLAEKPEISGLTAPGMPMVSPGMAPKGTPPQGYAVLGYKDGKQVGVFSQY
ncbi:hypothetical protein EOL70_06475 [Leucothrix sargassi]|nr:hypothetical protein EOL70_06475 [Leucothrix sargassi]